MDIDPDNPTPALNHLAHLKTHEKQAKRVAVDAEKARKDFEYALHEALEAKGVIGHKTTTHTFSLRTTLYGHIEDMDAFQAWAEENGEGETYFRTEEARGRINELVRDCIETGQELPPGVGWYPRKQITTTEN